MRGRKSVQFYRCISETLWFNRWTVVKVCKRAAMAMNTRGMWASDPHYPNGEYIRLQKGYRLSFLNRVHFDPLIDAPWIFKEKKGSDVYKNRTRRYRTYGQ